MSGELTEVIGAPNALTSFRRALFLGDALLETIVLRNGVPFRLDAHLDRMRAGAQRLGIDTPHDLSDRTIGFCVRGRNEGFRDGALRILLARAGALGLQSVSGNAVVLLEISSRTISTPTEPLAAIIATARRNERAATAGLKLPAFPEAILALREAREHGADEAIFLDSHDRVSEATASNVFIYNRGVIATPAEQCGILPGVTRATVLELAATLGIAAETRTITTEELRAAEEVFLTSTLRGIAAVGRLDNARIGDGGVGPVTARIRDAYESLVARECAP